MLRLLALLTFAWSTLPAQPAGAKPPNIVVIYIDDMGFGDLGVYGNSACPTPNIDRLAAQGTRFTQWYTNSPICSPSRAALMTGQAPQRWAIHSFIDGAAANRNRRMAHWLDPQAVVLPRLLKDNGYATAHFGKWHLGGGREIGDAPLSTEYGFDEQLHSFEGLGDRLLLRGEGLSEMSEKLGRGKMVWIDKGDATRMLVDRSIDFARRHKDGPFYLNLWPGDVHDPFRPTPEQLAKAEGMSDDPQWRKFFAVLMELDLQIGRFVDALDEMGVGENTLILFTSDNGPTAWPHYYRGGKGEGAAPGYTGGLRGRKWSLYEGGIRMPFIARWPGRVAEGHVNETTIGTMADLLPTLTALAGCDLPADYEPDGQNLLPQLLGENDAPREGPVFFEYDSYGGGNIRPFLDKDKSPTLAVREGDWKLLVNPDGSNLQLYNVAVDRDESENVADDNAELVERLQGELAAWYADVTNDGNATRLRVARPGD